MIREQIAKLLAGKQAQAIPRQRHVHPSKPVWWDRVKGPDGTWTSTPHYGTPAEPERDSPFAEALAAQLKRGKK